VLDSIVPRSVAGAVGQDLDELYKLRQVLGQGNLFRRRLGLDRSNSHPFVRWGVFGPHQVRQPLGELLLSFRQPLSLPIVDDVRIVRIVSPQFFGSILLLKVRPTRCFVELPLDHAKGNALDILKPFPHVCVHDPDVMLPLRRGDPPGGPKSIFVRLDFALRFIVGRSLVQDVVRGGRFSGAVPLPEVSFEQSLVC
jgi:hypothetical protein